MFAAIPTFLWRGITTNDREELIQVARNSPFDSDRVTAILLLSSPEALTRLRRPTPTDTSKHEGPSHGATSR